MFQFLKFFPMFHSRKIQNNLSHYNFQRLNCFQRLKSCTENTMKNTPKNYLNEESISNAQHVFHFFSAGQDHRIVQKIQVRRVVTLTTMDSVLKVVRVCTDHSIHSVHVFTVITAKQTAKRIHCLDAPICDFHSAKGKSFS